jgi:hypothetical protein
VPSAFLITLRLTTDVVCLYLLTRPFWRPVLCPKYRRNLNKFKIMKKSLWNGSLIALLLIASSQLTWADAPGVEHGAKVSSVVIRSKSSGLVVSGSVNRGIASHRSPGGHVHVQWVDSKGKTLAVGAQSLAPATPKRDAALNYRAKFSVALPSSVSTKVSTVHVQYVDKSHGECNAGGDKACPSC